MSLRIAACLCWYDEPVPFLYRCVSSLRHVVDELYAVDGAWELFPEGHHESDEKQRETIYRAAQRAKINATVWRAGAIWSSQVAKRNFLYSVAAGAGCDWLLVIDGDEYVHHSLDLHERLNVPEYVAQVECFQVKGHERTNSGGKIRRLFSAARGIHVEHAHCGVRDNEGRWLHGDSAFVQLEPAADLSGAITLHHEFNSRSPERNHRRTEYRMARRRAQIEAYPR